ncbi:MAG: magnesium transporter CorA family protein [Myxococcota bacterium]
MLTHHVGETGELQPVRDVGEAMRSPWVDVTDPSAEEVQQLNQKLGIPMDYLAHALDPDELARAEHGEGHSLVVMRIPVQREGHPDQPFTTVPLGVVISGGRLVTVCGVRQELTPALASAPNDAIHPHRPHRFVLRLLLMSAHRFLEHLKSINHQVDALEDRLQASLENDSLMGLLKYQKALVFFTTALRSNELLLERLRHDPHFPIPRAEEDLLEDVLIELRQAMEVTRIATEILSQMMDAFASIISNNLNVVMKFLASCTILLTIPTMIASFYGMNVPLPGSAHALALGVVVAVSTAVTLVVAVVLRRRKWL